MTFETKVNLNKEDDVINNPSVRLVDSIIKEAIPFAKKQHDRLGLELFSKSLFQICQARHKYKEAIHILSELYETS